MNEEEFSFSKEEITEASGMVKKYFELARTDPGNDLLIYFKYEGGNKFHFMRPLWGEFSQKFGDGSVFMKGQDETSAKHNTKVTLTLIKKYENALEAELERIDKGILGEWGI